MNLLAEPMKTIISWLKKNFFAIILTGVIIPIWIFAYEYYDSKREDYIKELEDAEIHLNYMIYQNAKLSTCLINFNEKSCFDKALGKNKEDYVNFFRKTFFDANNNHFKNLFKYKRIEQIYSILDKLESGLSIEVFDQELLRLNKELLLFLEFVRDEYKNNT